MRISEKQAKFARMIADLIIFAVDELDLDIGFADAYRDPRAFKGNQPYGRSTSLHKSRLAVDFVLRRDGVYLTDTESYRPLGEYWESIGGSWGGRFNDANHFSLAHGGRR